MRFRRRATSGAPAGGAESRTGELFGEEVRVCSAPWPESQVSFEPCRIVRSFFVAFPKGGPWSRFGFANVDCCGVESVLQMTGVILLDHVYARPAVFCDLIDVGSLHEA